MGFWPIRVEVDLAGPCPNQSPGRAGPCVPFPFAQAAILVKDESWVIRNLVLRDVIPLSLGIGLEDGGMKRIVERNSRIPCQRQGGTKTCVDNQVRWAVRGTYAVPRAMSTVALPRSQPRGTLAVRERHRKHWKRSVRRPGVTPACTAARAFRHGRLDLDAELARSN